MKIKLFSGTSIEKIEQDVNQFIRDKEVFNIMFCADRVLVVYEEGEIDVL